MSAECIRNVIYGNPTWLSLYQDPANDAALLTLLNDDSETQVNQSTWNNSALAPGHQHNRSMNHDFRVVYKDDPAGAEVKAAEMTGEFNRVMDAYVRDNETNADPAIAGKAANVKSYKAEFDSGVGGLDFADGAVQQILIDLFGLANSIPYRNLGFFPISPAQKNCSVDATQGDLDESRRIDGTENVRNRCDAADEAARAARGRGETYQQIVDAGAAAYNGYSGGP